MPYPRIIDASMGTNNWSVASHHLILLSAWYLTAAVYAFSSSWRLHFRSRVA